MTDALTPAATAGAPRKRRPAPVTVAATVCRVCGKIVKRPDPSRAETVLVYGPEFRSAQARGVPASPAEVAATRCDECADRRRLAASLLAQHPRVQRAHGSVALDRLDAALAALDVGGVLRRGRLVNDLTATDDDLAELILRMAALGALASWSSRGQLEGATKRWAHVRADLLADVRAEQTRLVRRLVEFPFPFTPPGADAGECAGCMFCGVGTLMVRESEALAAWGEQRRVDPSVLGGRHRPQPIAGHLCPPCRRAVEQVGAMGIPAVQRALLRHFGYTVTLGRALDFHGSLRAWVALKSGTPANRTPWAHMGPSMKEQLLDLERRGFIVKVARA
ncbi:hypothetical protein [Antiquaquibacter soli]|uniref:Uncharacterized protein n=1 Tax=Antiquaquibacter soli TaxID=3064523 RepID=A0ABT9BQV9_9MICO|nr:hypothetical protein [Protaetiibacter sp. WY-16]MDO7881785.1 hypothetical protein [Protaetiibacter sp. WY-16]